MDNIEKICKSLYGVDIINAPKEAVLWSAEKIPNKSKAIKELSRANRIRAKHGKPIVFAPYGHKAF